MEERILKKRYVIHDIIGKGGMAIVYLGYNLDSGEKVAVKMLRREHLDDEQLVRRFKKESQVTLEYNHKNIVNTIDVGEDDGCPYLVMEYVQGQTLKNHIAKMGALVHDEAIDIAVQVCEALTYAHSHQLVHRDIKPHNILLGSDGVVKVADFGIAKHADSSTMTINDSGVMGSVHYLSPEQARGGYIDKKSDLYSLGVVLYEMVTGVVPFTGEAPIVVAMKHISEDPVYPRIRNPHVPPSLEAVIMKAMDKDVSTRYYDAQELETDLKRCLTENEGWFVARRPSNPDGLTLRMPRMRDDGSIPGSAIERIAVKPVLTEKSSVQLAAQRGSYEKAPSLHRRLESSPVHKNQFGKNLTIILLSLAVIASLVIVYFSYIGNTHRLLVPKVVGMNLEEAQNLLSDSKLFSRIAYQNSAEIPKNQVISQDPASNSRIKEGGAVVLLVSSGPKTVRMPTLLGKTREQAESEIKAAGLTVGNVKFETSKEPENSVVNQVPNPDQEVEVNTQVDIWLARKLSQPAIELDNLVGMNKDTVIEYLDKLAIGVKEIIQEPSTYAKDVVIRQSPEPGTEMKAKDQVTLWVSSGLAGEYIYNFNQFVEILEDNTRVRIEIRDDMGTQVVQDDTEDKGTKQYILVIHFSTPGKKHVTVYTNNTIYEEKDITVD